MRRALRTGFGQARRLLLEHSIFPWSKVAFRDVRLPPDPFDLSDLSEASDLSVLPLRLSVMPEIISQQRRSATARWACSAMRMADAPDAPDASDGIWTGAPPPSWTFNISVE